MFGKDSKPINLPAFYIDKTEVTERAYREFAHAQGLADPNPAAMGNLPVTGITIEQARNFCASAGKRLPSAEEWEKAARGTNGRYYPWGNQEDATRANVALHEPPRLRPVGSFPSGISPFGVFDMTGNVWEYVDSRRLPTEQEAKEYQLGHPNSSLPSGTWQLIYGGSFNSQISTAKANDPAVIPPDIRIGSDIGFRCARDAHMVSTQD